MDRMGYIRGKRGFTLIEMIIAVALLAVAGTVVVRLFVHARVNNQMAADIDRSVFYGSAWIERIKSSPKSWIGGDPADPAVFVSEPGSYIVYYDKNWALLTGEEDRDGRAAYAMHIDLYEEPESRGLWTIELRTYRMEPYPLRHNSYEEIYRLSAMVNAAREVTGP